MKDSETLKKFLYVHLAPEHVKGKIREFLYLSIDKFKQRCRDICNADQQRSKESARNVNYNVNRPNQKRGKTNNVYNYRRMGQNSGYQNDAESFFNHPDRNYFNDARTISHPEVNYQGQTHRNNTPIVNEYQGRQNRNYNDTGNTRPLNPLCHIHRRYGDKAFVCAAPDTCEMAGVRARPTKNEPPSSSQ